MYKQAVEELPEGEMKTKLISLTEETPKQTRAVQDLTRDELMQQVNRMKEKIRTSHNGVQSKNEQIAQIT